MTATRRAFAGGALAVLLGGAMWIARGVGQPPDRVTDLVSLPSSASGILPPIVLPDGGSTVSFVALGDTGHGCGTSDGQCRVAAGMEKKCARDGCDFALLLGDNIYDTGVESADDPQFQEKFERPYRQLAFPFFVVLGNHDYGSGGAGLEVGKGKFEIEYTQRSRKWRMPASFYRVSFGNALEVFALDTQQVLLGNDHLQRRDVADWIAESKATWKIAFGHHPYLSNGPHGNAGNYNGLGFLPNLTRAAGRYVKRFLDDIVCGKVDIYLAGHDHSRQWLEETCGGTELIVSGGGASTTKLSGANKAHFQKDTLGFLYVKISGPTLVAEWVDAEGTVQASRTLTKPALPAR